MDERHDADRYEGGCLCGTVRFVAQGPARFCAHCHCSNCRRAHGAAFVTWVGVPNSALRFTAGEDALTHYATDTGATRSFCSRCGSTLLYAGPRWPEEVHVTRANVDGAPDLVPRGHAYVDHKAAWWSIDDELPQLGGESGMEPR